MGSVGPGTLLTVVLAMVGPETSTALAAFTARPISVVGTVPTSSISRMLLEESAVSRKAEVTVCVGWSRTVRTKVWVTRNCFYQTPGRP